MEVQPWLRNKRIEIFKSNYERRVKYKEKDEFDEYIDIIEYFDCTNNKLYENVLLDTMYFSRWFKYGEGFHPFIEIDNKVLEKKLVSLLEEVKKEVLILNNEKINIERITMKKKVLTSEGENKGEEI
jgi:hypothetical protein